MNILYINHYAGAPRHGMEFRPYSWRANGCAPGTACRSSPRAFARARRATAAGRRAHRRHRLPLAGHAAYAGNGVGRARNIAAFSRAVAPDAQRARRFRPDAVIASSTYPMDIWVARAIARQARPAARLVYEVHDLWPLSPIELAGMSPRHPFARLCQWAEDAAYRDADVVVSMLPKVHEHMAARGLDLRTADDRAQRHRRRDDWARRAAAAARRRGAPRSTGCARAGALVVGYAGSMGLPNALDTLLDAARCCADVPLGFVLVGDGHERAAPGAARRRRRQSRNVTLLPPIPKAQIPSFLARDRHRLHRLAACADLPLRHRAEQADGLHDGRLRGAAFGRGRQRSGGRERLRADGGARVAAAVAQGLRTLAALSSAERRAMGERGRAFVLAHHSYPVLARRFLDAIGR